MKNLLNSTLQYSNRRVLLPWTWWSLSQSRSCPRYILWSAYHSVQLRNTHSPDNEQNYLRRLATLMMTSMIWWSISNPFLAAVLLTPTASTHPCLSLMPSLPAASLWRRTLRHSGLSLTAMTMLLTGLILNTDKLISSFWLWVTSACSGQSPHSCQPAPACPDSAVDHQTWDQPWRPESRAPPDSQTLPSCRSAPWDPPSPGHPYTTPPTWHHIMMIKTVSGNDLQSIKPVEPWVDHWQWTSIGDEILNFILWSRLFWNLMNLNGQKLIPLLSQSW